MTRPRLARKYEQSKKGPLDSREAAPARRRLAGVYINASDLPPIRLDVCSSSMADVDAANHMLEAIRQMNGAEQAELFAYARHWVSERIF